MTTDIATREPQALAYRHELTVEELASQVQKIHTVMAKLMKTDTHYGVIPGTKKPTLYKPGAELLNMLFRLDPQYAIEESREGDHLTVRSTCTLFHIPTGMRLGSGMGSCSTREAKYAYRRAGRKCPSCGKEDTIIKGKADYGGGWLCFAKRGGCGAKYRDGDAAIEGQQTEERVANPDLPDAYNTVLKMANKRSLVAAVLNVTAASEIFTQDEAQGDEVPETEAVAPRGEAPAGGASATPPASSAPRPGPETVISDGQAKRLYAIARGSGWTEEQVHELLAAHGYASAKEVQLGRYDDLINAVKAAPKK